MRSFSEYTFRQLSPSIVLAISAACIPAIGHAKTKQLQGNVSKNAAAVRIQRYSPTTAPKNGTILKQSAKSEINSFLEHTDFQLPKTAGTSPPNAAPVPFQSTLENSRPLTGTLQENSNPSFKSKTSSQPSTSENGTGNSSSPSHDDKQKKNKQLIVIRLTYFMLDEQNPFYAFRFAEQLQKKHKDEVQVVLLLEKEATRCVNRELNTQLIFRNEQKAHKLSDLVLSFIHNGGQVVASNEWAKAFGVTEQNLVQGAQLQDNDEIGSLIVDATKILEY